MSATRATSSSAGFSRSTDSIKVLIVDDDKHVIDGIKRRLSRYDVEVVEGFHGVHGIWRSITEKPDLVITDVRMPLVDGEEVVRYLRSNQTTCAAPIFVLTGVGDPELEQKMLDLGVDRFFRKPIDCDALVAAMREFVTVVDRHAE